MIFNNFRLQTGMRGAFGKPQGLVARVNIGQPLMSVRTYDKHKESVIEALRRTKFKFPGRQKVNKQLTYTQCANFRIFLSLRFYVKLILGIVSVPNLSF